MAGTITLTHVAAATQLIIAALLLITVGSGAHDRSDKLLPPNATQQLKGVAILAVVFGHIGYFLVNDQRFLFPLSIGAGVGVNIFLLLSGYGLTQGLLNKPCAALDFYRRRIIRVFIPFWCALIGFFVLDAVVLDRFYPASYIVRSLLGFFPSADMARDVNSVFWYITWILFYYLLLPWLFMRKRPWLTALILFALGEWLVRWNPPALKPVMGLYQVHTLAFPLGILLAWLLFEERDKPNPFAAKLLEWKRHSAPLPHFIGLAIFAGIAAYSAYFSGVGENVVKEQLMSLITVTALVALFACKRVELRFLTLVGTYSYEIYLLHWPLLSRYDVLYRHLPAAVATLAYLLLFLVTGGLIQKITAPIGGWLESNSKRTVA
jgi:peptidoglycan/LPS O-acetylase OafA/YrhL